MKRLILIFLLIPSLCFGADAAKIMGVASDPSGTNNVNKVDAITWGTTAGNATKVMGAAAAAAGASGCVSAQGPTTEGSTIGAFAGDSRCVRFQASASCKVNRLYFWGAATAGGNMLAKFGLYSDKTGNVADALLASTAELTVTQQTLAWRNIAISEYTLESGSYYHLCAFGNATYSGYGYNSSASGTSYYAAFTYNGIPNPWGLTKNDSVRTHGFYVIWE